MDVLTDLSARGSRLRRIPLSATLPFKLAALRRFRFNHPSRQHGYEHAYMQITAMRRPSHYCSCQFLLDIRPRQFSSNGGSGKAHPLCTDNSLKTALLVTLFEANDTSGLPRTCEDFARFSLASSRSCLRKHIPPGKCPNRSRRQWQANTTMTPKLVLSTLVSFHKYIASLYCRCPTLASFDL